MMRDDAAKVRDEIAARALSIDPDTSNVILCVGTKGSGKSEAARVIFDGWPHDRAVIDITGDARPDDPATIALTKPFPAGMPEPVRDEPRVTVWARLDPRSPTLDLDHDQALALGLYPRRRPALVLVDEFARMATASRIPPNVDLALMSSRHYRLSLVLCFPRPRRVPLMAMQQADKILIFDVPSRDDRKTLVDSMGYPFEDFEEHYAETMHRPPHSFLLWDKRQHALLSCPPLPLTAVHGIRG